MEENQKKIEQIAGEKNIDSGNVMYDDTTHELIDLEDLLSQDSPVAHRINNLMKNGVSLEQVKNVYESIAAGGNSVEQALNELDKVFFVLAKTITDSPNEIVIDLYTGNIDHRETRKRIIELGLSDDYFEYTSKLKPMFVKTDTQATLDDFIEILSGKKETDSNSFIKHMEMFDQYKNFADDIRRIPLGLQNRILTTDLSGIDSELDDEEYEDEEIQDPEDIIEENDNNIPERHYNQKVEFQDDGIMYGEKKVPAEVIMALEDKANESSIENLADIKAFRALFSYARDRERNENTNNSIKNIKSAIPNVSSRYAHMFENIIDENGNINEEEIFRVVEEFQHSRNEGSVAKNLFKILRGDKTHKVDVLKTLARSFLHEDDNPEIIAAAKAVAEANGLEYTREGIQKAVYEVMNISFDSYEAFEAFAVGKELSTKTFEGKFDSIENAIKKESNKTVQDNSRLASSYRNDIKKSRKQNDKDRLLGEAFEYVIDEHSKIDEITGLNFKGHEVIAALKYFVDNNPNKDKNKPTYEIRMIKNYLIANREEFTKYFMAYTDINPYHNSGYVDMDAINDILSISPLPERSKENVENIISATQISAKVIDKKSKLDIVTSIENIYKETVGVNKGLNEQQIETVKRLMGRLNFSKLTPEFIDAVGQMHPELEVFVNKRNEDMHKAEQARSEVIGKQTKQNAIAESVELLEAKLNIFSGTPYYGKILAERRKFYENNPKAEDYRRKLYSVDGSLNILGTRQVKKYIDDYRDKKILDHVKGIDYRQLQGKEKENFTKWLLVGLSSKNSTVAEFAANYLKEMNPELYNAKDQFLLKELAYKTVYPDLKSLDEVFEKEETLKKNLTRLVFKESVVYTEERISDLNFREFYERHAELFDATATNLDLGEMQNYYLESEIKFTEQDEKSFHDLYEQSTIDSWLSTKSDASKMTLVTLYELKQRAIKTKIEDRVGSRNPEFIQKKIDKFLEMHPDIKDAYIDENGNIDRKLINKGRRFINDKVTSDILKGFSRTVFGNVQDYDDIDLRQQTTKNTYINVLVALQHAETIKDPKSQEMLRKLAYRALEMMNTDERKMIEFDRNGNPKLNEKEILKTFQDQKHSYETLDELKVAKYEQYKHVFMHRKMRDYDKKTEKDFFELESEEPEDQIAEIERIKRSQKAKYKAESEKKKSTAQIKEEKNAKKNEKRKINKAKSKDGVNSKRYKTAKSKERRAKSRAAQIENNRINKINNRHKQPKKDVSEIFAAQKMQIESDEKNSVNVVNTQSSSQIKKDTEKKETTEEITTKNNIVEKTTGASELATVAREEINNQTQAVEQRDGQNTIEEQKKNILQAEEVDASAAENKEENKKDFFKPLKEWWKRMTTPRIGDGKEPTKKIGFFAKLFGKKEEPKVDENETNNNSKEKVIQDGLSHIVLDNKDGKYDIGSSGNGKSQDTGKVSDAQQQEQEEFGELG